MEQEKRANYHAKKKKKKENEFNNSLWDEVSSPSDGACGNVVGGIVPNEMNRRPVLIRKLFANVNNKLF